MQPEDPIQVHWNVEERPLSDEDVRAAAGEALSHGGRGGVPLEVVMVDDPTLADLHHRFLGDPTPTDVMSFDLGDDGMGPVGEIYVSVDCARRVAAERGVEVARELALYVVHGTLHLCGHDDIDDGDRVRMREAETTVMNRLGYVPDMGQHDR